jgi:hypothetical protein
LAKNKANFEFNAARCTKNLTQFLGKRQAKLALLITDAFPRKFCQVLIANTPIFLPLTSLKIKAFLKNTF